MEKIVANIFKRFLILHLFMEDEEIILSYQDYANAISKALSPKQIEFLQYFYYCPNKSATAKELAQILNPVNPVPIISNSQIGRIGKAIADFLNVVPEGSYYDNGKLQFAWFTIVGGSYSKDIGWTMNIELQHALEYLKLVSSESNDNSNTQHLPTEEFSFDEKQFLKEGKIISVIVNRFERNQIARLECIKHYGDTCYVCGFDFNLVYGEIAKGFIHVHHKLQLSKIRNEYIIDPIHDLVPVCANCHSVIHLSRPALTIEEIKTLLNKNKKL